MSDTIRESTGTQVRDRVRTLLTELTPVGTTVADDAWLPQSVLDSLAIAEVLAFIEDAIGRSLELHEETESTIASIDAMVEFIQRNSAL